MQLVLYFFFFNFLLFISVGYLILWERHLLGGSHLRLGPNKNSIFGLMQSFFDAFKLLSKGLSVWQGTMSFSVFLYIIILFYLFLTIWLVLPNVMMSFFTSVLFFFSIVSLFMINMLMLCKNSGNKYSVISGFRLMILGMSYELVLFLLLIFYSMMSCGFFFSNGISFFFSLIMFFIYFFIITVELGRIPFDFLECESELVSGYNLEFGSFYFLILFLVEYGMILFFISSGVLFMFGNSFLLIFVFIFVFMFLRCSFPRFRYDLASGLFFFIFIPVLLGFVLLSMFYFF